MTNYFVGTAETLVDLVQEGVINPASSKDKSKIQFLRNKKLSKDKIKLAQDLQLHLKGMKPEHQFKPLSPEAELRLKWIGPANYIEEVDNLYFIQSAEGNIEYAFVAPASKKMVRGSIPKDVWEQEAACGMMKCSSDPMRLSPSDLTRIFGNKSAYILHEDECNLIRLKTNPNSMPVDVLTQLLDKKAAYALFDNQLYYIQNSTSIVKINHKADVVEKLKGTFPQASDTPKKAKLKDIRQLVNLTAFPPASQLYYYKNPGQLRKLRHKMEDTPALLAIFSKGDDEVVMPSPDQLEAISGMSGHSHSLAIPDNMAILRQLVPGVRNFQNDKENCDVFVDILNYYKMKAANLSKAQKKDEGNFGPSMEELQTTVIQIYKKLELLPSRLMAYYIKNMREMNARQSQEAPMGLSSSLDPVQARPIEISSDPEVLRSTLKMDRFTELLNCEHHEQDPLSWFRHYIILYLIRHVTKSTKYKDPVLAENKELMLLSVLHLCEMDLETRDPEYRHDMRKRAEWVITHIDDAGRRNEGLVEESALIKKINLPVFYFVSMAMTPSSSIGASDGDLKKSLEGAKKKIASLTVKGDSSVLMGLGGTGGYSMFSRPPVTGSSNGAACSYVR